MLTLLFLALAAHADPECKPGTPLEPALLACAKESATFSYLPTWIRDHRTICEAGGPSSFATCAARIVENAHQILTCHADPKRWQEAVEYDVEQIAAMSSFGSAAEIPPRIAAIYARLTSAAERIWKFNFAKPRWTLATYSHAMKNASAGAGGHIIASSGLWSGQTPLADDEVAAVLAHEISHVQRDHSLSLGCLALEWIGADVTVKDATLAFREDLSEGFPRKIAWKKMSQDFELEADSRAVDLLRAAGLDPGAMARALEGLRTPGAGGFTSGSHPDLEDRIRRLR